MAAPQIPNLLDSLRNSKGAKLARGGVGGSRGGASTSSSNTSSAHPPAPTSSADSRRSTSSADSVVQQTDDDASGSRLSAVEVGYLEDDFAKAFASPQQQQCAPRRQPVINRGTYVRTTAIDTLITDFLTSHLPASILLPSSSTNPSASAPPIQIISLGSGTDTRFFRLLQKHPILASYLRYHEIDFPDTCRKKVSAVACTPSLKNFLSSAARTAVDAVESGSTDTFCDNDDLGIGRSAEVEVSCAEARIRSLCYNLHPLDLRRLAEEPDIGDVLPGIANTIPTLLLSECCLTYIPSSTSGAILDYFSRHLSRRFWLPSDGPVHIQTSKKEPDPTFAVILYEPLNPTDPFGRTMISNLSARNITLPGFEGVPELSGHWTRLREHCSMSSREGGHVGGCEVVKWWDSHVPEEEKDRLRRVEGLDEEEEWMLLAGHYGFAWGWRGGDQPLKGVWREFER